MDSAQFKHDIAVTDLRILFAEAGFGDWISERVLAVRNELRVLPDGMIHHRGRHFAIEYEATAKTLRRYKDIFLDYELEDQIEKVLYIALTPRIATKIGQVANVCDKLCYTTLADFKERGLMVTLPGVKGTSSLGEVLEGRP